MATSLVFIGGCGPSGDTSREEIRPDSTSQKRATFETQTDTVTAQATSQHRDTRDPQNPGRLGFMVQIGSFSESRNATRIQTLARKRYQLPVVKEYSASKRRYQIRIGFFESEQAANEFRLKLTNDYPMEYKGAWVVRVNK